MILGINVRQDTDRHRNTDGNKGNISHHYLGQTNLQTCLPVCESKMENSYTYNQQIWLRDDFHTNLPSSV